MSNIVRVWDLPTRVFHWALAVFVVALVTSAQIGGEAMVWHFRLGYAVLSLLLFRIIWGAVGGHWSRFSSFIYSPSAVIRYARGRGLPQHSIGHNPLGASSVFALLTLLLVQVATGLVSDDEIAATGPLSKFVSSALVKGATFYHKDIGNLLLIGLVILHVAAILFYQFKKKENLVRPMILGNKETKIVTRSSRDDASSRALAAILLLGCIALVAEMVRIAA